MKVGQSRSKDKFNRLTAICWIHEFIKLGGVKLVSFYATVLGSIMFCISDVEQDICEATKGANQSFISLVRNTTEAFALSPIIQLLTMDLLSDHIATRVAALQWINMLHEKDPQEMILFIGDLLPALLKTLSDTAEEVVLLNIQVYIFFSFTTCNVCIFYLGFSQNFFG
jgi:vacuole morphology and inheritance protein 14